MIYALTILASVPFIGHYDGQTLFCNAPCAVVDAAGDVLYRSSAPIDAPVVLTQSDASVSVRQL